MNEKDILIALWKVHLAAVALWVAYYYIWRLVGRIWIRQRLFCIRQSLFMMAEKGVINRNMDEYRRLYSQLNDFIRNQPYFSGWTLWFVSPPTARVASSHFHNPKIKEIEKQLIIAIFLHLVFFNCSGMAYMAFVSIKRLFAPHRSQSAARIAFTKAAVSARATHQAEERRDRLVHA